MHDLNAETAPARPEVAASGGCRLNPTNQQAREVHSMMSHDTELAHLQREVMDRFNACPFSARPKPFLHSLITLFDLALPMIPAGPELGADGRPRLRLVSRDSAPVIR